MNSRFYVATCQIGAEKAVKADLMKAYPQLHFAFSRPGFITFKEAECATVALSPPKAIFVRLWGEVLFQIRDRENIPALLEQIPEAATLHCFDRDEFSPGYEPSGFIRNAHIQEALNEYPALLRSSAVEVGRPVYSIIWVDDFHLFLTRHIHQARYCSSAGNIPDIQLPPSSPSRAYLKIEEAVHRFSPNLRTGEQVLEVACAPGGASSALLSRGLKVTGIDPQKMDDSIYAHSTYTSVRKFARYVTAEDIRACNPDILVMDMSIPPLEALSELAHVLRVLRSLYGKKLQIRCGLLTLKLNEWKLAESIPLYLKRLEQLGFRDLTAMQLANNRQEFFVYAGGFV